MRTNLVHSGLLVAVGIQLPAVQSGLQSQGQAQEAEMYSEKSGWVPKSGKGKRERGCLEPRGWGGPRAIREPHSRFRRKGPARGSREGQTRAAYAPFLSKGPYLYPQARRKLGKWSHRRVAGQNESKFVGQLYTWHGRRYFTHTSFYFSKNSLICSFMHLFGHSTNIY